MLTYKDSLRQRLYSDSFEEGLRFGIKYFANYRSDNTAITSFISNIANESGLAESDIKDVIAKAKGKGTGNIATMGVIRDAIANSDLNADKVSKAITWINEKGMANGVSKADKTSQKYKDWAAANEKEHAAWLADPKNAGKIGELQAPSDPTKVTTAGTYKRLQQGKITRPELEALASKEKINTSGWTNDQFQAYENDVRERWRQAAYDRRNISHSYNGTTPAGSTGSTGNKAEKGLGNWIKKNPWKAGGIAAGAGLLGYGLYKASQPSDRDRYYR